MWHLAQRPRQRQRAMTPHTKHRERGWGRRREAEKIFHPLRYFRAATAWFIPRKISLCCLDCASFRLGTTLKCLRLFLMHRSLKIELRRVNGGGGSHSNICTSCNKKKKNSLMCFVLFAEWIRSGGKATHTRRIPWGTRSSSQLSWLPLAWWTARASSAHATQQSALEWTPTLDSQSASLQPLDTVDILRWGLHQTTWALLQGEAEMWTHQAYGAEQVLTVTINCSSCIMSYNG